MSNSNTELYKALLSGSSIDEIIRKEIQDIINLLLKTELTSFLDYEPYVQVATIQEIREMVRTQETLKQSMEKLLLRFLETVTLMI